jgi:hypothetical protein
VRLMTKRMTLLCAAMLVPMLAGCGSDGGGSAQSRGQGGGGGLDSLLPQDPSSSEPAEPTIDFSGIVEAGNWADVGVLRIVDPMNLEDQTEIHLPLSLAGYTRESFSADWQYAAWTTNSGTVQVGELDAAQLRYEPAFTFKPTKGGYSTRSMHYDNPRFSPDGETLWLEAVVENDDLTETHTLASVPYADYRPGDAPELSNLKTSYLAPAPAEEWWTFDHDGDPMLLREQDMQQIGEDEHDPVLADYWTDQSGAIVRLEIEAATHPEDLAYLGYQVADQVGPKEFIVATDPEGILTEDVAKKYGVVARATVDPAHDEVTLEPMVPLGVGGLPEWVMLSPDHTEALMCVHNAQGTRIVPYLVKLRQGAEPKQLSRVECAEDGTYSRLGWY